MQLYLETHGSGQPVLVLLHGMGANGAVWRPLLEVLEDLTRSSGDHCHVASCSA
jgi:pimeloyl-ACP methyl ester carboxylesterase